MSGWGTRKTIRLLGGLLRLTGSASGITTSVGGKRGRLSVSSSGRKRASVNLGGGLRWTKSRR